MAMQPHPRLFSVDEYYRLADAGILGEDDRVELIDGVVIQMTAIGSPHAACVTRFTVVFAERFARRALVRVQHPLRLSD
ncbi:MAG: Uma2 family endonuclease, partial [Actinomycetota bacterium]